MTLDYFDFKINLGKTIKLTGNAVNSKLGALLVGENFSLGIDALFEWPENSYLESNTGREITVTGVVIEKNNLPLFVHKEGEPVKFDIEVPEGTDLKNAGHRYLLQNVKWKQ
jgi:hypothetical protein